MKVSIDQLPSPEKYPGYATWPEMRSVAPRSVMSIPADIVYSNNAFIQPSQALLRAVCYWQPKITSKPFTTWCVPDSPSLLIFRATIFFQNLPSPPLCWVDFVEGGAAPKISVTLH